MKGMENGKEREREKVEERERERKKERASESNWLPPTQGWNLQSANFDWELNLQSFSTWPDPLSIEQHKSGLNSFYNLFELCVFRETHFGKFCLCNN